MRNRLAIFVSMLGLSLVLSSSIETRHDISSAFATIEPTRSLEPANAVAGARVLSHSQKGITDTPLALTSINVVPNNPTIEAGQVEQFQAVGTFSDASTRVLTPAEGGWNSAGVMAAGRANHTTTLLANGKVLITGGEPAVCMSCVPTSLTSAELYDPETGGFTSTASMSVGRTFHTATLLANGKVLIAGGTPPGSGSTIEPNLASAELFDPATGLFTATGSMSTSRAAHTATLLQDGRVLIAGGTSPYTCIGCGFCGSVECVLDSAEIFNPATGTFSPASGAMVNRRDFHTATLLPDGRVLLAGGRSSMCADFECPTLSSAEVFNPVTGTFSSTGGMSSARVLHTATLLSNGKVLVAGGSSTFCYWGTPCSGATLATAEVYDPGAGSFADTGSLSSPRALHTATRLFSGQVVITGGASCLSPCPALSSTEYYDQVSGTFTSVGNTVTARAMHRATLDSTGRLILIGGVSTNVCLGCLTGPGQSSAETLSMWTSSNPAVAPINQMGRATGENEGATTITATSGGIQGNTVLNVITLDSISVTPANPTVATGQTRQFTATATFSDASSRTLAGDTWASLAALPTRRRFLAAAEYNGLVYTFGGREDTFGTTRAETEAYNPATNTWSAKAPLPAAEMQAAAASPGNGKIYVMGGSVNGSAVREYDPIADCWTFKAPMPTARRGLAAVALNGRVYAIGGNGPSQAMEEYDPATDTWVVKAAMPTGRIYLAAAAVGGKIYAIAGSPDCCGNTQTNVVEEYDPATNSWTTKAPLPASVQVSAAAAANGKIYVFGGFVVCCFNVNTVYEYDPATDSWATKAAMPSARDEAPAVFAGGRIYVVGGADAARNHLANNEAYTPPEVVWSSGNQSVATIDQAGLATALGPGASTITAMSGIVSGNTVLTVTLGVMNTNDSGPGSLREAINQANGDGVPSIITFDPGLAGQSIQLQSPLPPLNENSTTINGDVNNDCIPDIELNGELVNESGIRVFSSNNLIRGLIINRFGRAGVVISGGQNNHVECCYIGTDATATLNLGNGGSGVRIEGGASDNQVGPGNVIAFNATGGGPEGGVAVLDGANFAYPDFTGLTPDYTGLFPVINFPNTSGAFRSIDGITPIDGNGHPFADEFGARFTGTLTVGATGSYTFTITNPDDQVQVVVDSVVILQSSCCAPTYETTISLGAGGHTIEVDYFDGPGAAGFRLDIAGAGSVSLSSGAQPGLLGEFFQLRIPSERNRITQNSIFENNRLGIELDALEDGFGVNPNDPGDTDIGPNTALNFPEINFVTDNGSGSFTLDGFAPPNSTVEIFATTGDDPSGHGEGKLYLTTVTANGGGGFSATVTAPPGFTAVTATATDAEGNTSEFSRNKTLAQSRWGQTPIFSNLPDIFGPTGYVTGDLDGDGRLDIVAAGNASPCRLLVLKQNLSGNYDGISQEPMGANEGLCDGREALALGDVDADGDLDFVAQGRDNTSTPRLILFLNDGTGNFTQQPDLFGPGLFQGTVAFGDVDNDGDLDLAATGQDSNGTERFLIFSNNGAGTFNLTQEPRGAGNGYIHGSSLVFGDLDKDGDLDIIVSGGGSSGRSLHIYKNSGGQMNLDQQLIVQTEGLNNSLLRLADLDKDGDLDLVASGNNFDGVRERVRIVRFDNLGNSFSGGFTTLQELDTVGGWAGLAVGDCNGDGYPDVFANGHDGLNSRLFYFEGGPGGLVEADQPQVSFVGPIVFGDFDSDNDLDMVGLPVRELYTNLLGPANSAPGIPSGLSANLSGSSASLTWASAADAETAFQSLGYEVRLGTAPGQYNVISGVYGTPLMGSYPLGRIASTQPGRRLNLGAGTYYWQVRAIDTGLRAGDWSAESSFTLQPSIIINNVAVTEGNAGTVQADFIVTLLNPAGTATVDYFTSNGTAMAGSDYTAAAGTLALSAASPVQTISITVNGDTVGEANETFFVNLNNVSGAIITDNQGQGIINNDDPAPAISINDVAAREGNSGTGSLFFTVSMTGATHQNVMVDYNLVDQSATAGSDYVADSGTITLFAGETTHTLVVTINGDTNVEGDETFRVDLSNAQNAALTDGQGIGTITDDEGVTEPSLDTTWQLAQAGMADNLGAATNGSIYVLTENFGGIWTSPDGINWTKRTNPDTTSKPVRAVTFGGGQFVAVGLAPVADGGGLVLTSPDGITWTQRSTAPLTRSLFGVAYGNGLYVATTGGAVLTSPDAITWTQRPAGTNQRLNSITFGGGQFVAVGNNRTVVTSPDGITWSVRGGIPSAMPSLLNAVTHDGSQFIAVSADPSNRPDTGSGVMTSPDGINWTQQSVPVNQPLQGVTVGGGLIVAVGNAGSSGTTLITSPDGINWTSRAVTGLGAGVSSTIRTLTHGPAGFVAGGPRGSIFTSPDGITTWVSRTLATSRTFFGVTHNGATYCAVGANGIAATSPDAVTWTEQTTPDPTAYYFWWSVTHGNGLFVASGISDSIMTSPDGVTWTVRNPATPLVPFGNQTSNLTDITYANGMFVAVGEAYVTPSQTIAHFITSPDGITWTTHDPGITAAGNIGFNWIAIAYGNGKFVAALTDGLTGEFYVLTSPDAQNWTRQPSPLFDPFETFQAIVYTGGQFVAVGDRIWTSPDGINWTLRLDYANTFFNGVAQGGGRLIAVGVQGTIYASADGVNWAPQTGATVHSQIAITASLSGEQFVSVGQSAIEYAGFSVPSVSINDITVAEGDLGTSNATFTLTLSSAISQAVTVDYATADGTATAGSDYVASAGQVTFAPNQTAQTLSIPLIGDTVNEPLKTFFVNLTGAANATIADNQGTCTIVNDDAPPGLSISDATLLEGNSGSVNAIFTVTLLPATPDTVTVNFTTANGTAVAPGDYTSTSGGLTFLPGDTTKTILVPVNGDTIVEADENFFVNLLGETNATLQDGQAQGLIINDDGGPIVNTTVFTPPNISNNAGTDFEVAVVENTGLAYVGAPGAYGTEIAVIHPASNTVVTVIPISSPNLFRYSRVNQTTRLVYFSGSGPGHNNIVVIDGRPSSATFNEELPPLIFPAEVQSFAIDETHGRLYVTSVNLQVQPLQSRVTIVDANPSSATFHQVLGEVLFPVGARVRGVAVNSVTGKVYMAVTNNSPGVYVMDGTGSGLSVIAGSTPTFGVAVNEASNLVYATAVGNNLNAIDGATNTLLANIPLPALITATRSFDEKIAIHTGMGRVYVQSQDIVSSGKVVVVDGDRASPNFNTVLTTIDVGRALNSSDILVDEALNRVITTSFIDFSTSIIDATTNAVISSIPSTQAPSGAALNRITHRLFIANQPNFVQKVNLSTSSLEATILTAASAERGVVNPNTHLYYAGRTTDTATVRVFDKHGEVGGVAGLPHGAGEYSFAICNPTTNRIYSLNTSSNLDGNGFVLPSFVSVIDGATSSVIANVNAGNQPREMALNQATNKIYVTNTPLFQGNQQLPGGITVIDGATNTATSADVSAFPGAFSFEEIAANEATNKAYVQIFYDDENITLGVLDGATNIVTPLNVAVGEIVAIRVDKVLNRIYLVGFDGTLHILDGATDTEIATLNVTSGGVPRDVVVSEATGRLFVADFDSDSLTVVNGATNSIVTMLPVGDGPAAIAVDELTNRIYVSSVNDKALFCINGNTLAIETTFVLPLRAAHLTVDSHDGRLYASTLNGIDLSGIMIVDICSYTITPLSLAYPKKGGSGTVNVSAQAGCEWTVTGNPDWITITSQIPASGNGSVTYAVRENLSDPPRTATLIIGGQPHTVVQDGKPATGCSYSISPSGASFSAGGGTGSIAVTAGAGCSWTAVTLDPWITITSGSSGSGNGTVNYTVAALAGGGSRKGEIIVAGKTFNVKQK